MNAAENIELIELVQRVRTWPASMRIVLARQILETLEGPSVPAPSKLARGPSSAEIAVMFKTDKPAPDDIMRRQIDLNHAHDAVQICLTTFEIAPISRTTLELARNYPGNDYEDNLQLACPTEAQMDAIVTRDPSGYSGATIPVLTPADLLAQLARATP